MKDYIKRLFMYFSMGMLFTFIIVIMYDGGIVYIDVVLESALLFTIITINMEKIMMVIYTKIILPSIVRQLIIISIGTVLYSFVAWAAKPWSIAKFLFKLPAFFFAVLPMFVIFSIIFERMFKKEQKICNDKLAEVKNRIQNSRVE